MARKKLTTFEKLERKYVRKNNSLFASGEGKELLNTLKNGQNAYLRFNRFESSAMDFEWVKMIIDCIPSISEIVENPKKTIQTLTEVVQVEKVKKVGVETVQHLSSHTQYIKSVDENGEVTPSKLLNIYSDDYYAIYENKFVATLIRHLLLFVEKRYEILKKTDTMSDVNVLYAKNHTVIDGNEIEIETKVKYNQPVFAGGNEKLKSFMKQIEDIRHYIKFYMHTEFMHILRREKDVRNPILQTNIIRKNPKYHKCYLLWLYINKYRDSGIEMKVDEEYSELDKEEINDINKVMCANFLLLKGKDIKRTSKRKIKVYKPKILQTYDDTIYKPPYYDGPIEFVRVDEKYRNYTETLYDLNPHPTRAQALYNIEKYRKNKKLREKSKQIDALLARKKHEGEKYEENEAIAAQREIDRDAYVDALAEKEIREEAIARTEKERKKLIKEADWDQKRQLTLAKLRRMKAKLRPLKDIKKDLKNTEKMTNKKSKKAKAQAKPSKQDKKATQAKKKK